MSRNKVYVVFICIVILLAAGIGIYTRSTYKVQAVSVGNYLERGNEYKLSQFTSTSFLSIYFDNNITEFVQLQEKSDLIAKVKTTNERLNYNQAILTGVNVETVYKGDIKQGNRVYLYEPSYFGGLSYFVTGGYNIMQEGQEYIVFLKHLKVPSGYHYKDDEDISFMPVSSLYGKYPLQSKRNTHVVSENTEDSYYQVKDFDILTQEESTLKKYEEFKRLVMQQMK